MACNHPAKRRRVLAEWYVRRRKRAEKLSPVDGDRYRVTTCDACRAIKFATFNEYSFTETPFVGELMLP